MDMTEMEAIRLCQEAPKKLKQLANYFDELKAEIEENNEIPIP